jgi:hypothetical protein
MRPHSITPSVAARLAPTVLASTLVACGHSEAQSDNASSPGADAERTRTTPCAPHPAAALS